MGAAEHRDKRHCAYRMFGVQIPMVHIQGLKLQSARMVAQWPTTVGAPRT
jgi:hypothetical protein